MLSDFLSVDHISRLIGSHSRCKSLPFHQSDSLDFTQDSVLRSHTDQTHIGRCWGLWRLSLGVGSKTVCTAHSCVRPCCEDSCHKLLRWRFLKPRTRPCQSDTSPSAGYSYTLQTSRKQNRGDSVSQHKIWQLFHLQQLVQFKVIMIDYWFTRIHKNWTWSDTFDFDVTI